MQIKKEDSKGKRNSESCFVWEYPFESRNLGFATARINGRYPEEGCSLNEVCEMAYYVISGYGTMSCNGRYYELKEGDLIYIKPKTKYWTKGKNLLVAIASTPAWYPEQYKHIRE